MTDFSQLTPEDYLRILNKRKWWIVLPAILFLCGGVVLAKVLPKVYLANTLVLVESQKVPRAYVQSTVTSEVEERLKTIQEEVMSRSRLYEVMERFKLFPDLRDTLSIDQLIGKMRKSIRIQIRHKDAFAIYYEGDDPKTVAKVANALTEQFINANLKLREEQARETANFLEEMLRDQQETLVKRETALAEFLHKHAGELPEHTERNLKLIEQLNMEMTNKQVGLKIANEEKLAIEKQIAALEEMAPEAMEDSTKSVLRKKLFDLENEMSLLKLTYTDSHPKIILLQNQIDNLGALIYQVNDENESTGPEKVKNTIDPEEMARLTEDLEKSATKLEKLENELSTFQEKIKIQEDLLASQEKKWADFLEIHPDILPEPISQNLQLIEQLNVQIMTKQVAIKKEKEKRDSLKDQIENVNEQSVVASNNSDPKIIKLRKEEQKLEKEITLLKASYNESHPILDGKIKELENLHVAIEKFSLEQKEKEAKAKRANSIQEEKIAELKNNLAIAKEAIANLEQDKIKIREQIKINHARVDNAPNLEVELKELTRQYNQERNQYEELLAKNLDAELARKLELRQKGEQFIRLDEAVAPNAPYKPDRQRILVLSAVLGFGLGLGLAFVREFFDDTFVDRKDIEKHLKVQVLASIPHITEFDPAKKWFFWKKKNANPQPTIGGENIDSLSLLEQNLPTSVQEIYRVLKVKLVHNCKNKKGGNSFLVTSAEPQEGKTTTAMHLAWVISQGLDTKVVLVDCDFYKPKVATSLGIKTSKGLCEYLAGNASSSEILVPILQDKLCAIIAGKVADGSEKLLESDKMRTLLDELKTNFDYVILDIPSIMATVHEVNVLTPRIDHILFVVRSEKTKRNVITHSLSLVNKNKLAGIVLNDTKSTKRSTYDRYVQYKQNEPPESLEIANASTAISELNDPSAISQKNNSNGQSKEKRVNETASSVAQDLKEKKIAGEIHDNEETQKEKSHEGKDKFHDDVSADRQNKDKVAIDNSLAKNPLKDRIRKFLNTQEKSDFPNNGSNGESKSVMESSSTTSSGSTRSINERSPRKNTGPSLVPNPLRSAKNDSKSAKTYIRMILDDKDGQPYAHKNYKLVVDGKEYSGKTNSKGLVDEEIPANSKKGELSLRINDNDPSEVLIWPLHISKS